MVAISKSRHIAARVAGFIVLLFFGALMALQLPQVQSALARYVCSLVSGKLDGRLEIRALQLHPFNAVTIRDAAIIDSNPYTEDRYDKGYAPADTLLKVGKLSATLSLRNLFRKGGIHFGRVEIDDVTFNLVREPDVPNGSNIKRILNLGDGGKSSVPDDTLFTVGKLRVRNARYTMVNFCPSRIRHKEGINYEDMDVRFDLDGHGIGFWGGRCHAVADRLTAKEKSGCDILRLSGECAVGRGLTEISGLMMADGFGSTIDLPQVNFIYEGTRSWSDFVNAVTMDIVFNRSHVAMPSVTAYSGGALSGCTLEADIDGGRFTGTVNDFMLRDIDVSGMRGASGRIEGRVEGITAIASARTDASLRNFRFTAAGLAGILSDLGVKQNIGKLAQGMVFRLDASCSGPLDDLKASASVAAGQGMLKVSAVARGLMRKAADISCTLSSESMDLGRIFGIPALGLCSLSGTAGASFGRGGTDAKLSGLRISRLGFLGYDYSGIDMDAALQDGRLTALLQSSDPNAKLDLSGEFDLKGQSGQISATIENADLAAINIDKRGGVSRIACSINGEQGINPDNPLCILIEDLYLTDDNGTHGIGDIDIDARLEGERLTLVLGSEFADARYNGPSDLPSLISYAKSISVSEFLPDFFPESGDGTGIKASDATLSAVFHDSSALLAFLLPGAEIAAGTTLNADIEADGTLLQYLTSPLLSYKGISGRNIKMAVDNQNGQLSCTVNAEELDVKGMDFNMASVAVRAEDNVARLALNYENADLLDQGSELYIDAALARDQHGKPVIDLFARPSFFRIKDQVWELEESQLHFSDDLLSVDGFTLASDTRRLSLAGEFSTVSEGTLHVDLRNMDLALLNAFTKNTDAEFHGIIDGTANLHSPVGEGLSLDADLRINGLGVDDVEAGDIRMVSTLDDSGKNMHLWMVNTKEGRHALEVNGTCNLQERTVDATLALDSFDVDIAGPFVKSILPEISGQLSGRISAGGRADRLHLSSEAVRISGLRTRIGPTNVVYTVDGPFSIDDDGLQFNEIGLRDEYGGLGTARGRLGFRNFRDFSLDVSLDMFRLKAIDIPTKGDMAVYGDLAVSGTGRLSGAFDNLLLDADIATAGPGTVSVPVSAAASQAQGSDLLVFTSPDGNAAPQERSAAGAAPRRKRSKFSAHARVTLHPEAIASIEIDKNSGHMLTAGGSGTLMVDLDADKGGLEVKGDYNIDSGKYQFKIPGIVSKDFDIRQGSSIKFNGDIMESALDISVLHTVKTSLTPLVGRDNSASSRRIVECGIGIGGKLRNPEVSFSIDVPDLEPNTQILVNAALNSEDKVQKQFVALLLLGTFLPEEGSGVVNGTNMIISNVGEIVSSHLNNILRKLDIPLDFGIGYQQDHVGTDIFDVAVSTQLFNNRVIVNGSVGNRKYSTSTSANGDMVGDLDIEIKIGRRGEVRFNIFSHSADEYTSSLDFSQRNGIGLSYQKEFYRLRDFLRRQFMKRSKRREAVADEAEKRKVMKTIKIDGKD